MHVRRDSCSETALQGGRSVCSAVMSLMKDDACIISLGVVYPLVLHYSTNVTMVLTDFFITKLTALGVILRL